MELYVHNHYTIASIVSTRSVTNPRVTASFPILPLGCLYIRDCQARHSRQ